MRNQGIPVPIQDITYCFIVGKNPEDTLVSCSFLHNRECYLGWSLMVGSPTGRFKTGCSSIPKTCPLQDLMGKISSLDYELDLLEEEDREELELNQEEIDKLLDEALETRIPHYNGSHFK